jgi:hypothetical protein
MRDSKLKSATAAFALSLGILGATLPLAAEAAPQPPQCNAVTGCGTLLDYIRNLFLKA